MDNRKSRMLLLVGLVLGSAACAEGGTPVAPVGDTFEAARSAPRSSLPTITEIAASNPDFEILTAALNATGLAAVLDGNQHFTVFAPTDAAFENTFGSGNCGTVDGCMNFLVGALGVDGVRNVLLYHVTRGDRNSTAVVKSGKVRMLNDQTAPVTVQNGKVYIDEAEIVAVDIRASNGLVHVLGGVMIP